MKITKQYTKSYLGNYTRKKTEKRLFAQGYRVESEEDTKNWDAGQACCLAVIFLPLVFFGKKECVKVTYSNANDHNTNHPGRTDLNEASGS